MSKNPEKPNFEESLAWLEDIVLRLEAGKISLDESLVLYEQGVGLLRDCHELLEGARRRIEVLAGVGEDGVPTTREMEDAEISLEERAKTRGRRGL